VLQFRARLFSSVIEFLLVASSATTGEESDLRDSVMRPMSSQDGLRESAVLYLRRSFCSRRFARCSHVSARSHAAVRSGQMALPSIFHDEKRSEGRCLTLPGGVKGGFVVQMSALTARACCGTTQRLPAILDRRQRAVSRAKVRPLPSTEKQVLTGKSMANGYRPDIAFTMLTAPH